jgi:hypothetical protein
MAERRPALTASARGGVRNLRSGQKKACGAVEQKKGPKQESKSARKKALAFVAAIRERRNGIPGRTKKPIKKARKIAALKPLDNKEPIQGTSGSNREAESTDAPVRGAPPRSSDEAG